ncbi:MAG: hypothetical protein ACRBF0_01840 [Calditrichia bacterium]
MLRVIAISFSLSLTLIACSCTDYVPTPPSPEVRVDTTSHNFVWKTDTLGPLGTSLNDVEFISDSEVWAVGRIQYVDSMGNNNPFGLAKFKNNSWSFNKLEDEPNRVVVGARKIWAFGNNDIWFAAGSVFHWTGGPYAPISWLRDTSTPEIAISIWGDTSERIFAVGSGGLLLSFDGSSWTRHPRAGSASLLDVYGKTSGDVWACGYSTNPGRQKRLLFRQIMPFCRITPIHLIRRHKSSLKYQKKVLFS